MYFININITKYVLEWTWKWKSQRYVVVFTWIVFIELNFTVAFLLIRKTWDDGFAGKVGGQEGGCEILRNGGGGGDFQIGGWYPFMNYAINFS